VRAGSGLSKLQGARPAATEASLAARAPLEGDEADLAVVFASPHFSAEAETIVDAVHEVMAPRHLIGCVAEAVLGGSEEVEGKPAVSVWAAHLPGGAETFFLEYSESGFSGWPERSNGSFLLLCDPFSFPADALLTELNDRHPEAVVIGGLASGGHGPGASRLFRDRTVVSSGAVAARVGGLEVRTLVSQGCRPIGRTYVVTRAEHNVIHELGGKPALERVRELYAHANEQDRGLLTQGLLIGRVIDEYKPEFGRGDFLVRTVIGGDPETGAMAIGDVVSVGQTIQFHVRDASTADEDLQQMLDQAVRSLQGRSPGGALLFTCNGRGSRLFETPNHDAALIAGRLGVSALAGFFCAGEVGPIGGKNFVHGFTASLAMFCEQEAHPQRR
jgi:small ligand-binding sensory domain FIST